MARCPGAAGAKAGTFAADIGAPEETSSSASAVEARESARSGGVTASSAALHTSNEPDSGAYNAGFPPEVRVSGRFERTGPAFPDPLHPRGANAMRECGSGEVRASGPCLSDEYASSAPPTPPAADMSESDDNVS